MKMKLYISLSLMLMTGVAWSQTMQWVPVQAITDYGQCAVVPDKKDHLQCWILQYTPAVSGVLTSYTTGFLINCTSLGIAVSDNHSCAMNSNSRVIDGCGSAGYFLMNSSGNTGASGHNQIEAGKPVTLHQVCFSIPPGESITIEEDPVTDLTTSIDLGSSQYTTEYPAFEAVVIRSKYVLPVTPVFWLDFHVLPISHLVSQIDWSASESGDLDEVEIERSHDGIRFSAIDAHMQRQGVSSIAMFQSIDKNALPGYNYYRLKKTDSQGQIIYSPVKSVRFDETPLEVFASPNPVSDRIFIQLSETTMTGTIVLMDVLGKERAHVEFEQGSTSLSIGVRQLEGGLYTLIVSAGESTYTEKIVVTH